MDLVWRCAVECANYGRIFRETSKCHEGCWYHCRARFLNLSTTDFWGQIVLCFRADLCIVGHSASLTSTHQRPAAHPLPFPQWWQTKMSPKILPNVPWRAKSTLIANYCSTGRGKTELVDRRKSLEVSGKMKFHKKWEIMTCSQLGSYTQEMGWDVWSREIFKIRVWVLRHWERTWVENGNLQSFCVLVGYRGVTVWCWR